jgi:hypothetical protein
MKNKKYVPKHLNAEQPTRGKRIEMKPVDDENPVDLDWLNKFIDECQKENSIYDKKGDM